jgi:hypothetical protein
MNEQEQKVAGDYDPEDYPATGPVMSEELERMLAGPQPLK